MLPNDVNASSEYDHYFSRLLYYAGVLHSISSFANQQ